MKENAQKERRTDWGEKKTHTASKGKEKKDREGALDSGVVLRRGEQEALLVESSKP